MTFGERLKQLRQQNNLTQDELAAQINLFFRTKLDKTAISRMENDKQKPSIEYLENFAQFFDVSIDYMNGGGVMGVDTDYDEILELRQDLRENPDMKILFSMSRKATKSDIQEAIRLLRVLKKARSGNEEEG